MSDASPAAPAAATAATTAKKSLVLASAVVEPGNIMPSCPIPGHMLPTMDFFIETQLKFTHAMADRNYHDKLEHEKVKKEYDEIKAAHSSLEDSYAVLNDHHEELKDSHEELKRKFTQLHNASMMMKNASALLEEAGLKLKKDNDALLEKTKQLEKELLKAKKAEENAMERVKTARLFNSRMFKDLMGKAVEECMEKSSFEKATVVAEESQRAGKKQKLAQ